MRKNVKHGQLWMVLSMVGAVASISALPMRHSLVVVEKLYQTVKTRKTSLCNMTNKNVYERKVVFFQILIGEAKFLSFFEIC